MIVRLIVFIAIFFIGWWLYRQFIMFKSKQSPVKSEKAESSAKEDAQESMVRCEKCKTFMPRSHAIHDQDARPFCSADHLKDYNKNN